ncbi:MAG TPA: efflux RND transporter periplasmic adaptor subunit [Caulobacteraceae bacterium]|jgi:RND family efflux transporter MFP subunit|nr:efflux RND transporter periplasmic adaptor subunit [Caulobacteraceae bacterium]
MKAASVLLVPVLLVAGCSAKDKAPAGPAVGAVQTVEVVSVKSQLLSTTAPLPGQLVPYESVDLFPKVAGFIQDISVDRGTRVRKGQVLARLTAPEVVEQEGQAAAALGSFQAKLAADRATYERLANAAKTPGVVAENDVNIAGQAAASDAALVKSAAESAAAARQLGAYLDIRAPFDGVITARNLHPGALVGPATSAGAQPILQLVTTGRLRLVVPVPEDEVQGVKVGDLIDFTLPTAPGRTFHAPIARIAQAVDTRTRTMMVEADITNPNAELTPGVFANVQWPVRRSYPTLRVPLTAVANDQQRQFVIVAAHGAAIWVDVTTGMTADGALEIFGKLSPGDLVVKRGTDAIASGAKIRAVVAK